MRDGRRRLIGRLFYWALVGITAIGFRLLAFGYRLSLHTRRGARLLITFRTLCFWRMAARRQGR